MTVTQTLADTGRTGHIPADAVPVVAPAHLHEIAHRVERRLDAMMQREQDRWTALDPALADPLRSLRRLAAAGGKRLRPAFCHWGFVALGGDPDDPAALDQLEQVGVAFELLHAFALVHDDVMDGADRRRGEPTAHVEHQRRHDESGWRGESRRYGEGVAILIGDLAHVLADRAMADQPAAVLAIWRELQTELMMGQYLDVLGTATGERAPARASLVMQLKSGRYTIERPLQTGAAIAVDCGHPRVGDADAHAALDHYGRLLGQAFQLRDDLLGAFGTADTTGKPVGDDLREGKPTLLLALAVRDAQPAQRALLDRVGRPDLADDEIAGIQEVLVATGARAASEQAVADLTSEAVLALDIPAVPAHARRPLTELGRFIAGRHH